MSLMPCFFYPFILIIYMAMPTRSQAIHSPLDIMHASFGTYNKDFNNVFSFSNNQAILSGVKNFSAGVEATRKFLIPELDKLAMALSFPILTGGVGFEVVHFGFADYSESRLGLAYGKRLGKIIDLGIGFDYQFIQIAGYGKASVPYLEASILMHPSDRVTAGIQVFNPSGGNIGKGLNEKLAFAYRFGIGYEVSPELSTSFEIVKVEQMPINIRTDLEYIFAKQFFACLGIETAWMTPFASVGLQWNNLKIGLTSSYHLQLGFTPSLILAFQPPLTDKMK